VTPVNDNAPQFFSSTRRNTTEPRAWSSDVCASDLDLPAQTVSFSLNGGVDAAKFSITSGGVLSFNSAPDYETPTDVGADNVYNLTVRSDDGNGSTTDQSKIGRESWRERMELSVTIG